MAIVFFISFKKKLFFQFSKKKLGFFFQRNIKCLIKPIEKNPIFDIVPGNGAKT